MEHKHDKTSGKARKLVLFRTHRQWGQELGSILACKEVTGLQGARGGEGLSGARGRRCVRRWPVWVLLEGGPGVRVSPPRGWEMETPSCPETTFQRRGPRVSEKDTPKLSGAHSHNRQHS